MTRPARCRLCGSGRGRAVESENYARIWSELERLFGLALPWAVKGPLTPAPRVELLQCDDCGLQHFAPAVAGSAEFYGALSTAPAGYYSDDKWDFDAAERIIGAGDRVLDVACGAGAWLRRLAARGIDAVGVDANPDATAAAKAAGLDARCEPLERFAASHDAAFDVVTAFQVIEHLEEVAPFVRSAMRCLRPGGRLVLTVPNRERSWKGEFEPLEFPPHHLSRWSAAQFGTLAGLCGGRVVDVAFEPLDMHQCRAVLRRRVPIAKRVVGRIAFGPATYRLWRQLGLLDALRLRGLSLMAVVQK